MSLRKCKDCSVPISHSALLCPHCGAVLPSTPDADLRRGIRRFFLSQFRFTIWAVIVLGVVALFLIPYIVDNQIFADLSARLGRMFFIAAIIVLFLGELVIYLIDRLANRP